jgi:membrane dipeptidase
VDARALHFASPVVDAHVDTVHALLRGRDLLVRGDEGHVDLPRLREGGVRIQVFALYIDPEYKPERALPRVLVLWDALMRALRRAGGQVRLCRTPEDLDAVLAGEGLGAVLSVEGGEAIGTELALLRVLHALGVRAMGLTWNQRNAIADGAGEDRAQGGLTEFGRQVVAEMNRLGMVVDVSHLCERAFWDVLEVSRQPVIASHSNARALCDHVRNLRDEQIRALAAGGGVMGINFFAGFLDADPARADVGRVCDHIDHVCALVGPAHVGLGSDFDGIPRTPAGLEDCSRLPALTEELLRRGYRAGDVQAILGGNFLRVFRQVWGAGAPA